MRHILHSAVAVLAASALLLAPGHPAQASSPSSSSSGPVAPDPEDPADPEDPEAPEAPATGLVATVEKALAADGHSVDPALTAIARQIADDRDPQPDLTAYLQQFIDAGYLAAAVRGYQGPDGLESQIALWEAGHEDLASITGENVGVAVSTEPDDRGWVQLVIVHADEITTASTE